MVEVVQINDRTWRIENEFVRFFLLEGEEKSALIDTGASCPNALEVAKDITEKEVILINTHGDPDHISGTKAFGEIYMHEEDYINCGMQESFPDTKLIPVSDEELIDLGGRTLKIIHIPGHTYGSIAIIDIENRVLYAGDSVQKGHIYMFGEKRCPEKYEESLEKLISYKDEYDEIYASHDEFLLPKEYVFKVKDTWNSIRNGRVNFENINLYEKVVKSYSTEICGFYM